MSNDAGTTPTLGSLQHIGMVVKDVDKAMEYYSALGMGPFELYIVRDREAWVHGKLTTCTLKIGFCPLGAGVTLALVECVDGQGIHDEILECYGGGINHIAFAVEDLEGETARMEKTGVAPAMIPVAEKPDNVYFDTREIGDTYIEFYRMGRFEQGLMELNSQKQRL
ncbi:VOC family protein [Chloroflexota bacterium]